MGEILLNLVTLIGCRLFVTSVALKTITLSVFQKSYHPVPWRDLIL
jgi:hypothetical protein